MKQNSCLEKMLVNYLKHKISSKKQYPTVIEELCHQFSWNDLKKSTNNFDNDRIIGTGNEHFKQVYRGCLKHNGESDYPIAVKVMWQRGATRRRKAMKNIIELHCQLHHPNLISLIGFCANKYATCLVYEYMCNGSLHDRLCSRDMESLSWKKTLEICIGAAKGLHYLHTGAKCPILNHDISTSNILLDSKMVPKLKLQPFSLQGKFSKLEQKPIEVVVHQISGTIGYLAPENLLRNTFITDKCDVYSFGVVLLDVACTNFKHTALDKIHMFLEESEENIFEDAIEEHLEDYDEISEESEEGNEIKFIQDDFHEKFLDADKIIDPILMRLIAPQCLAVFKDIVKPCLKYDPNERPAMGEVEVELEHALALQQEWEK